MISFCYFLPDVLSSHHWIFSVPAQTWVPENCLQPWALRDSQSSIPFSSLPDPTLVAHTLPHVNRISHVYLHHRYRQQHGRTFHCFQTAAFSGWLGPIRTGFGFGRRVRSSRNNDLDYVVRKVDNTIHQAPVVRRPDNAIHRINRYPVDSIVCFATTYLALDSDLSSTRATSHAFGASRLANSDLQNKTDYIAVYQ